MTWIQIILYIISEIPELIGIVQKIIAFIQSLSSAQNAAAKAQFEAAIQSGDKNQVRQVVDSWSTKILPATVS